MADEKKTENAEQMKADAAETAMEAMEQKEEAETKAGIHALIKRLSKVTVELTYPVEYAGRTYESIEMDFEGITGAQIEALEDEMTALRIPISATPATSRKYQRMLAAKAAGVDYAMLTKLNAADYNKVTTAAKYFLQVTG